MDALARIIDANANRAREGVRTLEDVARFALGDAAAAENLKAVRHAITESIGTLPISPATILNARDTAGDVGTTLEDIGAGGRASLAGVVRSAGGRAGEALRVLEESATALGAPGGVFGSMRYRVYDLERDIASALSARAPQWRVCLVLTAELCKGRDPVDIARGAIEGGAGCVQIREKSMGGRALGDLTRRVIEIARPAGIAVIVNDRADVALAAGADGVHVGQGDLSVGACRRVLGEGAIVGVSTSTIDEAGRAVSDGASYCGCGSMFASSTKPKPELAGVGYLREYLADERTREVPHLAIGGVSAENAGELAAAGCLGVAVSGAICGADDPAGACRSIVAALGVASGRDAAH